VRVGEEGDQLVSDVESASMHRAMDTFARITTTDYDVQFYL
jgi:hypothetical protein